MRIFLFISFLCSSLQVQAASCCGGGFAFPALILGDDKGLLSTSLSQSKVTDDVLENSKWVRRSDNNQSQTLKLEGALLLSDSVQAGLVLPIISRQIANEQSSGLGDISTNLGYEILPELSYSKWKPKGVAFLQVTLPTSPSVYDFSTAQASDSRGRGFFTLGGGVILTKVFGAWDVNTSAEVHRSFERTFDSEAAGGKITALPGWGHSLTVGGGWNIADVRLGTSLSTLYEDAIQTRGAQSSQGAAQKNMTWTAVASYMLGLEAAVTLSYADQTLFGAPENTTLSKTLTLSYQQRWQR